MNSQTSTYVLLGRLWQHLNPRRRCQFLLLLVLILIASISEIISIGAVLPFLGALTAPDRIFALAFIQPLIKEFGLVNPNQLLLPLTFLFGLSGLMAGAMRLLLLWTSTRLSFASGADLSIDIYRRTLYQPYSVHCARNSSEVIDSVSVKANSIIYGIVFPALMLISSFVMLVAILFALLVVQPLFALVTFGGFGLIYLAIIRVTRKQLHSDGECVARESIAVIKSLQEGLGGIRDVLIDGSQEAYCQIYRKADISLRRAQGSVLFISIGPRYVMEALGMVLIAALAYLFAQQPDGIAKVIPVMGALALGAQRLLPVLQQAYGAWTQISSSRASLRDTLDLLDQPLPEHFGKEVSGIRFNQSICLKDLVFRYDKNSPYIFKGMSLEIRKGSRVGFIGSTGSGKSTLLDIIMGLLSPTEGALEIDGQVITALNQRSWQCRIAHVPQAIFLADCTIEENIAFGVPKDRIDQCLVMEVAKLAQISDIIESWPRGYQTLVGERGIRLSGGQRQRIGIARALYKQADVIVFDEATSALDNITEDAVMKSIEGLSKDLTLLIIAHRLTTLRNCDHIVELADGGIKRISSYSSICN